MHGLSHHIELLYNLSFTPSGRQHFVQSSIVNQLMIMLRKDALIKSAQDHQHLFNADVGIVAFSLLLLMNLAYDKNIFFTLKKIDLIQICSELQSAKDNTIQFVSQMLITILNQEQIDENNQPDKLKEAYMAYLDNAIFKTKQGTKLGVLRNIIGIIKLSIEI